MVVVAVEELIALFCGDEFTAACPTDALAERICEHLKPTGTGNLKNTLYGEGWPTDEIDMCEREALMRGYTNWMRNGRRPAT